MSLLSTSGRTEEALGPMPRLLTDCVLLLVDDEEANLDLLEAFLEPDGFAGLIRASDARDVVPVFEARSPDIVLLDLHMPHCSGFELMHEIGRRTPAGEFVPILVLTADASPGVRARALSEGAHDFLTKPLDAVEVRLRVRNLLKMRLLQRMHQRATQAREQVLSVVAHDLRNPLASIVMDMEMLSNLLSEDEHAVQSRIVHRIERTAQRMHSLVEDLLEVSRLEHGTFAVRAQSVAPLAVFGEAESMLRPLAQARAIDLSFGGPTELPDVRADAERIVQVFSNLIGNALQFTAAGGSVRVSWRADAGEVIVTVTDSGAGIAPELLPHVFEAFWQGSASGRRGGAGLGLVITRAIIEAHGGRIWIASTVGSGTAVHFTIPVASSAAPSEIAAVTPVERIS